MLQTCSDCGQLIVASNTIHVIWGHISILEADLICLNKNYQANQSNVTFNSHSVDKKTKLTFITELTLIPAANGNFHLEIPLLVNVL